MYCCVQKCENSKKSDPNISYHRFPKRDAVLCKAWYDVLNVPEGTNSMVCENHFTEDDFFGTSAQSGTKRLKRGRIPSRNLYRSPMQKKGKGIKRRYDITPVIPSKLKEGDPQNLDVSKGKTLPMNALQNTPSSSNSSEKAEQLIPPTVKYTCLNSTALPTNNYQSVKIGVLGFATIPRQEQIQHKPPPSVQFQKSRFSKLLNEASAYIGVVCKRLEAEEQSLSEHASVFHGIESPKDPKPVSITFSKEYLRNQTATNWNTSKCTEKICNIVSELHETLLPDESMICSEENHKGTQTRVVTVDKSCQTDTPTREILLAKENQNLRLQINALQLSQGKLETIPGSSKKKVLYLYKPA